MWHMPLVGKLPWSKREEDMTQRERLGSQLVTVLEAVEVAMEDNYIR